MYFIINFFQEICHSIVLENVSLYHTDHTNYIVKIEQRHTHQMPIIPTVNQQHSVFSLESSLLLGWWPVKVSSITWTLTYHLSFILSSLLFSSFYNYSLTMILLTILNTVFQHPTSQIFQTKIILCCWSRRKNFKLSLRKNLSEEIF